MTPLTRAGERTSDVALTFGWLLAERLLLLQLPAPLGLQHRVLVLGLPVDVAGGWRAEVRKGVRKASGGVGLVGR